VFGSSIVALVTPMMSDGSIDEISFAKLVEWHCEAGTSSLVIGGTTGESATLTFAEQQKLVKIALEYRDKINIIASTGCSSTAETIERTLSMQKLGVDGCLLVTPCYNKPTQLGLYRHYSSISDAVNVPCILYNVPSRTSNDLQVETVVHCSKLSQIVGIKDATGDISRLRSMLQMCCSGFKFYSGDDLSTIDFLRQGGHGMVSVTGNVVPDLIAQMCNAYLDGDLSCAHDINQSLIPMYRALHIETNPIPVKWALFRLGRINSPALRLPLVELSRSHHPVVKKALETIKELKIMKEQHEIN